MFVGLPISRNKRNKMMLKAIRFDVRIDLWHQVDDDPMQDRICLSNLLVQFSLPSRLGVCSWSHTQSRTRMSFQLRYKALHVVYPEQRLPVVKWMVHHEWHIWYGTKACPRDYAGFDRFSTNNGHILIHPLKLSLSSIFPSIV
jgi:hypothetical protein